MESTHHTAGVAFRCTPSAHNWLQRPGKERVRQPVAGCDPQSQTGGYFHHLFQPSNQVLIHLLSHPLLFRQTPAVKGFSFVQEAGSRVFCFHIGKKILASGGAIAHKENGLERLNSSAKTANHSVAHWPTMNTLSVNTRGTSCNNSDLPKTHPLMPKRRGSRTRF